MYLYAATFVYSVYISAPAQVNITFFTFVRHFTVVAFPLIVPLNPLCYNVRKGQGRSLPIVSPKKTERKRLPYVYLINS